MPFLNVDLTRTLNINMVDGSRRDCRINPSSCFWYEEDTCRREGTKAKGLTKRQKMVSIQIHNLILNLINFKEQIDSMELVRYLSQHNVP